MCSGVAAGRSETLRSTRRRRGRRVRDLRGQVGLRRGRHHLYLTAAPSSLPGGAEVHSHHRRWMVRRASYSRTPAQSPGRMSPVRRPTTSSTCPCRPPHPRGATARLPACPAASSRSRSSLPAFSRGRLALVRALRRRSASTMTRGQAAPRHGACPIERQTLAHASMPSHDHA